jgi:hypothetical protein
MKMRSERRARYVRRIVGTDLCLSEREGCGRWGDAQMRILVFQIGKLWENPCLICFRCINRGIPSGTWVIFRGGYLRKYPL